LRPSIRQRLEEAEEAAQQQDDAVEQDPVESNPVDEEENPVELAAGAALQAKLDEQPDPEVEPKLPDDEYSAEFDSDEYDDDVHELNMRLADAAAQVAGHKRGSRGYADAVASRLRQEEDTPRRERSAVPIAMPVSRESPSWTSGRSSPSRTELSSEEVSLAHALDIDPEEYRRNKIRMNQMKKAGVIQE
jgi:hypothetical protein